MKGTPLLTAVGKPTSVFPNPSSQGFPIAPASPSGLPDLAQGSPVSSESLDPDSLAPEFPGNFGVI